MSAAAARSIQPRRQRQHGPLAARMAAALPPEAQQLLRDAGGWLDPAGAFLAAADGLTAAQACGRARNAERWGARWPDRPVFCDPTTTSITRDADDPAEILEAIEAAEGALAADDAAQRLGAADAREADTADLAQQLRVTRRRAQQLRSEAIEAARRGQQGDLFGGEI